jgi:hypothetical protein
MALSNLSPNKTCLVGRRFTAVSLQGTRDVIVEGMQQQQLYVCLFNVSLMSSDFEQSSVFVLLRWSKSIFKSISLNTFHVNTLLMLVINYPYKQCAHTITNFLTCRLTHKYRCMKQAMNYFLYNLVYKSQ